MSRLRFLIVLLLSLAVHAWLIWALETCQPPRLALAKGESSAEALASRASTPRPFIPPPARQVVQTPQVVLLILDTTPAHKRPEKQAAAALPKAAEKPAREAKPIESPPQRLPLPPPPDTPPVPKEEPLALKWPELPKPLPREQEPPAELAPPQPKPIQEEPPPKLPQPVASAMKPSDKPPSLAQPASLPSERRVGGVRIEAQLLGQQKPTYPEEARRLGIEGRVVLKLQVSAEGRVTASGVHESSGYRILDEHTLRFGSGMRFEPARQGNTPIATEAYVPVRYRLY